jgi:TonB-linked SusC/RagA family outer membrane protein
MQLIAYCKAWPGCLWARVLLNSKTWLIMKLIIFLTIVSCLQVQAGSYAQTISLSVRNAPLESVLKQIKKQSGLHLVYRDEWMDDAARVSIRLKDATLQEALNACFKNQALTYELVNKTIVVKKAITPLEQHADRKLEEESQDIVLAGRVTTKAGVPLEGVSIVVKGTKDGTATDADGRFQMSVVSGTNVELVFSFVGYQTKTIKVGIQTIFNIVMEEIIAKMEEVVMIGYGTQKKSNISGAITSVSSAELHTTTTNDAGQALQGKVPVYVTRSSGAPGAGTSIFLRGVGTMQNSSPLWIIDGVKGLPLDNFQNVESIEILKDAASTAIYGIEGANGVILVTTKSGVKGKISVNYSGYMKVNNALGLPQLLGTKAYSDMYVNRWKSNNPTLDPATVLKSFYLQPDSYYESLPSTDWVDVMFGTGVDQVHSLSVSGGSDKSDYFISALREDDKGTYGNTKYSKTALSLKANQKIAKWLKFQESINFRHSRNQPVISTTGTTSESYVWLSLLRANPAMNVYDPTNPMGTGYGYFTDEFMNTIDWQGNNPLESANAADYWVKQDNIVGNFGMVATPIKGLVWTTNVLGELNNNQSSKFFYDNYGGNSINTQLYTKRQESKDQFSYSNGSSRRYFLSSFVEYNKTIGKNNFGIMAGGEVFQSESYSAAGSAKFGIPAETFRTTELAPRENVAGDNHIGSDGGYSQFGRLTYDWDGKYLMTATVRNDASSKFAPGKRQALFPAVSVGWNIAKESFFNVYNVNELKLRYGLGESGNDDVPSDLWRQEYSQDPATGVLAASKVINQNITWEKTVTNNLGIDLGLFQNALTASIDLYRKKTHDALLGVSLPNSTGFGSYYVNKGEILNTGIELMLGYRTKIQNFFMAVNGNVTFNKNKVLNLGESSFLGGGDFNRTYQNGPVSSFYGYVADGIYQSQKEIDALNAAAVAKGFDSYDGTVAPGDIKFKDMDGDGSITGDGDQTSIGNPWPSYIFGLNFRCSYKGIDFSMNWQGVADIDVYNNTLQYTQNMFSDYNSTRDVLNAWSETNKNTSVPRLGNSAHNYGLANSYMVEDASYLRLKSLQLGYDLTQLFSISKSKSQQLRIYVNMENVLTFTKFRGFDPEFMSGNNYQRGVYDIVQYPQYRSLVFGIQVGL